MTEPCTLCAADNGNYDFGCDSCCALFISHAPTKTIRVAWLNRWLAEYGEERTAHIKQLVQSEWEKHRQEAMGFRK